MQKVNIHFRLATANDRARIIDVVNAAFAIESFFEGTRTDPDRMQKLENEGRFLVGEDGTGCVVATIYAEIRGDHGYLGMLAVDPAVQGNGFARPMMEAGEDYLRQHGCRFADITALNLRPELLPVYRRWGYVEVGTEPFLSSWREIKDGFDCYCINMTKPL